MNSFKKPLAEKVRKRRMKRQEERERKLERMLVGDEQPACKKPVEKHPPGLRGKQIGLWYASRKKARERENDGAGKKKTRKTDKQTCSVVQYYELDVHPAIEHTIQEYLRSVENVPPPSLAAQLNVLKANLKRRSMPNKQRRQQDRNADSNTNDNNLVESTVFDASQTVITDSCAEVQQRLGNENDANDVIISQLMKSPQKLRPMLLSDMVLCSVDKYKYLENTAFKRRFLNNLTGTIESNLQKAVCNSAMTSRGNDWLDTKYRKLFEAKCCRSLYRRMLVDRKRLPAFQMRREILQTIKQNQVVLISGETGCGKTTQVAQFILDDALENNYGSQCNIVCTQPRRICAVSVANRVAQERCEIVGQESVGYHIRLDSKLPRSEGGSILFCTTGILIQHLQSDPALSKFSHIILDEIHERDTICDFALAIIRDIIAKRRELKVVLMSATLNAECFAEYFDNCPVVHIPGTTFPVERYYLEDVLHTSKFVCNVKTKKSANTRMPEDFKTHILPYVRSLKADNCYAPFVLEYLSDPDSEQINFDLIVHLIRFINCTSEPGAILIFVPGWEDISSINRKITQSAWFRSSGYQIIPLHSMMPTVNQQSVFERPPPGVRKVIIATNIAETSITIDDVVYVIDCGKIKMKNFNVVDNISTLKPEWVSRSNAKQRSGRAGRVQSGICLHLFTRAREKLFSDYPLPEMLRTRLEEVVLNIKFLQLGQITSFLSKVLDPPHPNAIRSSIDLLSKLNALDEYENLTPLGYHLAQLPLDAQIGKMLLLACMFSCLNPILSVAAVLNFKDPFFTPLGFEKEVTEKKRQLDNGQRSDHLIMAEIMRRWEEAERQRSGKEFCEEFFVTRSTMFLLKDQKSQIARYLYHMKFLPSAKPDYYKSATMNRNSENLAVLKAVICAGLYPNVAVVQRKIKSKGKSLLLLRTAEDGKVVCHPRSVNAAPQTSDFCGSFLLYHQKLQSSNIFLHDTTVTSALPLLLFGHDFSVGSSSSSGNNHRRRRHHQATISLKSGLNFLCTTQMADLIIELRFRLDWFLEYTLSHPDEMMGNKNTHDSLLRTLIELVTYDDNKLMRGNDSDSDSDSDTDSDSSTNTSSSSS